MNSSRLAHRSALLALAALPLAAAPAAQARRHTRHRPAPAHAAPAAPVRTAPAPASDAEALVRGENQFAADLYARLAERPGNVVVSPASVDLALAMTYDGARNATAAEMARVLHFTLAPGAQDAALAAQLSSWNAPQQRAFQLAVANRVFVERDFRLDADFQRRVAQSFGAPAEAVDFVHAAEQARAGINSWVSVQTRGHIASLLPEGSVDENTRLVLTNAVYFQGRWQDGFDRGSTYDEGFYVDGGAASTPVPMMHRTGDALVTSVPHGEMVELPYQGGRLAMDVIVPAERDGVRGVEGELTAENLSQWASALGHEQVELSVPRFDAAGGFELSSTLAAMGMRSPFTTRGPTAADFSGLADVRPGELSVTGVYHQATVAVDEEGTVATAATAVVGGMETTAVRPPPTVVRADHPFVWLIRDTRSGAVLFLGRVQNPTG